MRVSAALTADLRSLSKTLHDPTVDISAILNSLAADTSRAITLFLGMSITANAGGHPFIFTATRTSFRSTVSASMRVPLPNSARPTYDLNGSPADLGASILYAGTPGALVDLVADVTWLAGIPPARRWSLIKTSCHPPPTADLKTLWSSTKRWEYCSPAATYPGTPSTSWIPGHLARGRPAQRRTASTGQPQRPSVNDMTRQRSPDLRP